MPSVLDILRPQVVVGLMNEVRTPYDRWQEFFGMGPKGPNCVPSETRSVALDVVNDERDVAQFSSPGADASVVAPMVIGTKTVTCPRTFEKMTLDYERLNNIRSIGKAADPGSQAGLSYVRQMSGKMLRRTRRWREFLIWGMLRGTCQFAISGDDWIPVASGGDVTLDWQVPAGNLNQLGGIIGTSWNDPTNAPIITDLGEISAVSEAASGMPIAHAWCNTSRWVKILNNAEVVRLGGSSNSPFEIFQFSGRVLSGYGGDGTQIQGRLNESVGVLRGYPSILWHITDRGTKLGTSPTFTKYLGDDEVIFHPEVDNEWTWMYEVKESTNQGYGGAPVDAYGFASWLKQPVDADTPKYIQYFLDNAFPVRNRYAVFFADVTP